MNRPDPMTHEEAVELLPWLVNKSLPADEQQALLEHSRDCMLCRRDIAELESLRGRIAPASNGLDTPAPDMRRINRRIDEYEARRRRFPDLLQATASWLARPLHAAVVLQSIAIVVLAGLLLAPRDDRAVYTTLTESSALPPGEYARVVVSTGLSDERFNALLRQFELVAAEELSDRGVATLAFDEGISDESRRAVIDELAEHPDVRFVQPLSVTTP